MGVSRTVCVVKDATVHGVSDTDAQIEAWSAEAERGYPVDSLRRRGRRPIGDEPGAVVPVRMDPALLATLSERAERDQLGRSEVIRAAARAWIDAA